MALLEETNVCSICERQVSGYVAGGVPVYFCNPCYETHKDDILQRAPWVLLLVGLEKARRKRRNRLIKQIGIPVMVHDFSGAMS